MRLVGVLFLFFTVIAGFGQELPMGYISYFESSFSSEALHKDIIFSDQADYSIENGAIILKNRIDSLAGFKPASLMLIDNIILGDFIAEAQLSYKSESFDSLSGIFFIAGLRDSSNYYYVRINEQGAFFNQVYNGKESSVKYDSSLRISHDKWVTVQIKRDIIKRSLHIKYNGSETKFIDPNLIMGYIGFGVEGYTLSIDKINIWAPTSISKAANIFR